MPCVHHVASDIDCSSRRANFVPLSVRAYTQWGFVFYPWSRLTLKRVDRLVLWWKEDRRQCSCIGRVLRGLLTQDNVKRVDDSVMQGKHEQIGMSATAQLQDRAIARLTRECIRGWYCSRINDVVSTWTLCGRLVCAALQPLGHVQQQVL